MIIYEDECVGCPKEMGCMGSACPYMNVPHYCCDGCGYEDDEFYTFFDGWGIDTEDIYCYDCVIDNITTEMIEAFFEEDNYYENESIKYFYCSGAYNKDCDESKTLTKEQVKAITDEEYKAIRADYIKNGDPLKGWKYIKEEQHLATEFFEFICEKHRVD